MKAEQFRQSAISSTGALLSYSELLLRLASPDLLPKETFDELAQNLNANTYAAAYALTDETPDEARLALFSAAAVEIARSYLESRRRGDLVRALKENQTSIQNFADCMREGVRIAATHASQEYDEQSQFLFRQMITGSGPAPESVRRSAIQGLIDLDQRYIEKLETLGSLHRAFDLVPNAHAELVRAAEKPKMNLASIVTLLEEGKRLEANFDRSLASSKAKAAQAIADRAKANADKLEAEADAARLRSAAAKVDAVKAKAEADADPGNPQKQSRARVLEERAQQLELEADRREGTARKAQEAAEEAQQKADEIKGKLLSEEGM
jgi:hypothetical protein